MKRIPLQSVDVNLRKEDINSAWKEGKNSIEKKTESLILIRSHLEKSDISSYHPYLNEAMSYFYEAEVEYLMNMESFYNIQEEINFSIRTFLVDWIIDVHDRLNFAEETLYLTINIIDRFLGLRNVPKNKLHLVGISSLFIASKYEEVIPPSIKTFLALGDEGFTQKDIYNVEKYLLQVLDYRLDFPSPLNYLRMVSKADNYNEATRNMGKYLLEITFIDEKLNTFRYTIRAVTAMYMARIFLKMNDYEDIFWHYCGFKKSEINECLKCIITFLKARNLPEYIRKKYSSMRLEKYISYLDVYF